MNIVLGLLFILLLAVVAVFAFCYKIPQLLQVILMRSMLNKVTERVYVSKLRRLWNFVLVKLRVRRCDGNDPDNNK